MFEVDIAELFTKLGQGCGEVNLSILEKVKLVNTLEQEEKNAPFKVIDMASQKKG